MTVDELLSSSLLLRVIECVDGRREGVMLVLFWFWKQTEECFLEEEGSTSNPIIKEPLRCIPVSDVYNECTKY